MKRVVAASLFGPILESLQWCKMIIGPTQTEQSKNHKKTAFQPTQEYTYAEKSLCY